MKSQANKSIDIPQIIDHDTILTPHQKNYDEFKKMKDAVTTDEKIQEFTNIKHFMRDNQIKCFKYNYSLEEIV